MWGRGNQGKSSQTNRLIITETGKKNIDPTEEVAIVGTENDESIFDSYSKSNCKILGIPKLALLESFIENPTLSLKESDLVMIHVSQLFREKGIVKQIQNIPHMALEDTGWDIIKHDNEEVTNGAILKNSLEPHDRDG